MATLSQEKLKHLFLGLLAGLVLLMLVVLATELIANIFLPEYLVGGAQDAFPADGRSVPGTG
ncbi:hypothetical protein HWV23_16715 [Natronomonas halophila]|uniref:hypothetical protein n=1 Tax=Natronomonas halophila TaxID=2747817 RepID=UPI0015B534EB|nr:hypothetical protein [Natronomonas halophila]QLD87295.1 hypothetical protein HWV23_16715 [Natronomonas halophila]